MYFAVYKLMCACKTGLWSGSVCEVGAAVWCPSSQQLVIRFFQCFWSFPWIILFCWHQKTTSSIRSYGNLWCLSQKSRFCVRFRKSLINISCFYTASHVFSRMIRILMLSIPGVIFHFEVFWKSGIVVPFSQLVFFFSPYAASWSEGPGVCVFCITWKN